MDSGPPPVPIPSFFFVVKKKIRSEKRDTRKSHKVRSLSGPSYRSTLVSAVVLDGGL